MATELYSCTLPASPLTSRFPIHPPNWAPNSPPGRPKALSVSTLACRPSAKVPLVECGFIPQDINQLPLPTRIPPTLIPDSALNPSLRPSRPVPRKPLAARGLAAKSRFCGCASVCGSAARATPWTSRTMTRVLAQRRRTNVRGESPRLAARAGTWGILLSTTRRPRSSLIPVADKLDNGMAGHRFALHLAGNLARALVFVYANRRHHFLLPDQGLDAQACLQHRDGDHPMGWIAFAGRGALPDARGARGERLDIDDLMATIGMQHCRERMLLVTVTDVPAASAVSIVEADPHPGPFHVHPERGTHLPPLPIEPRRAGDSVRLPVDHDRARGFHVRQGVFVIDIPVKREDPRPQIRK